MSIVQGTQDERDIMKTMENRTVTERSDIPDAPYYVLAEDRFMSGWGQAEGMRNVVVLPCSDDQEARDVESYALFQRDEMKRVRIVTNKPRMKADVLYSLLTRETARAWFPKR